MCLSNMANLCLLTLITIHLCLSPQRMVLLQKGLELAALDTLTSLREKFPDKTSAHIGTSKVKEFVPYLKAL